MPGAGWIGLDATSGLMAGEGHIPLACTAVPASAAPVYGFADPSEVQFEFEMRVTRIHEDPRVTKPYTPSAVAGDRSARPARATTELTPGDVRLTMGGEPTFVSVDDMDGAEWNFDALGEKQARARRRCCCAGCKDSFSPGGLLHYGQGKWYPGEPLPRWALTCLWRADGMPLWRDAKLLARRGPGLRPLVAATRRRSPRVLTGRLGLHRDYLIPAYEDVWDVLAGEQRRRRSTSIRSSAT